MSKSNGKFKNRGSNSKKVQRVTSAKARKEEFDALSPEQRKERMASNKQEYQYWHDGQERLNGGEREAGLPLHD